ncbi:hypothetical protein BDZ94DRAFT_1347540, partial [Collybia nuda]
KKPKTPSDWHLTKAEIPKDASKTKHALEVHIHALWQLPHQNAVPPVVTNVDQAHFEQHFSSEKDVVSLVHTSLNTHARNINDTQSAVNTLLSSLQPEGCSATGNHICHISSGFLLLMFRTVASFGLVHWAPDILSNDPDSMYNLLHEHIALITFEQVATAYGYSHVGINHSIIKKFSLLRKSYHNFVFSYMYKIMKLEGKSPGSGWFDIIKAQGFNEKTATLAEEAKAHSDDELPESDSPEQAYNIKLKDGRLAKPSTLTALLKNVPIDWFDPEYWNTLTVKECMDYILDGVRVALPLEEYCKTWAQCDAWKNLPEKEFMHCYGKFVLEKYKLPTKAEMEQLK